MEELQFYVGHILDRHLDKLNIAVVFQPGLENIEGGGITVSMCLYPLILCNLINKCP
jgi:hypothetical protein